MGQSWLTKPVSKIRGRGEAVRNFILAEVKDHPTDIVRIATEHFDCSRQAIHKHIQRLVKEDAVAEGWVTKRGRSVVFCETEVTGPPSGKQIARGFMTYNVSTLRPMKP
jgi:hypothetical protein